ncbi:MAG: hypothetical protein ACFHWX_22830 [Bacteroidota bacterium]
MNENRWKFLIYPIVLGVLFGILHYMKFIVPHYEPEEYEQDFTIVHGIPEEEEETTNETNSHESSASVEETTPVEKETASFSSESDTDEFFLELKKKYETNVLNSLAPGKPRSDVIIRYYKHPPDGDKVYNLKNLGFYIHERPIDEAMTNYESNSIFFGDNVSKEDLLIVAYSLIKEGIPIKNIAPSQYHDGWKNNAIEIGVDSTVIHRKVLTLEQLKDQFL